MTGPIHEKYFVGPKTVVSGGKRGPIIYLPKDFNFLIGKRVFLTIEVFEPPKKNPEYVFEGVG